jgi:hypothetical protein
VGLEPIIPAFKRAKTVHAIDHAIGVRIHLVAHNTIFSNGKRRYVHISCILCLYNSYLHNPLLFKFILIIIPTMPISLTRVEAGSNTSTVTLRVVRGDEMGLKKAAPQLKQLIAGFPLLRSGVRDWVCHVGFCGGQSGAGVGFLRVLRFPLTIFISPIAPKIILIYHRGLYNRPKWP